MSQWQDALVQDLGGDVSAQEATIIELATRTKFLLDGIDAWLRSQGRPPVDKRPKKLWHVVKDTMPMRNALVGIMTSLGLERQEPKGISLSEYVEEQYGDREPAPGPRPREGH